MIIEDHIQHPQTFTELIIDYHKYNSSFDLYSHIDEYEKNEYETNIFSVNGLLCDATTISKYEMEFTVWPNKHCKIYELYQYYDLYIVYDFESYATDDDADMYYVPIYDNRDVFVKWMNDSIKIYKKTKCTHNQILNNINDFDFILRYFKNVGKNEMLKYMSEVFDDKFAGSEEYSSTE